MDIYWELDCNNETALDLLSQAIDQKFRPWFAATKNFKGEIIGNQFNIWVNSPRRGFPPANLRGEIIPNGQNSLLSAHIKLVFPFYLFKFSSKGNWVIGIVAFVSWLLCVASLFFQSLSNILSWGFPLAFISISTLVLSFIRYVGEEEYNDLNKLLEKLYGKYRVDS